MLKDPVIKEAHLYRMVGMSFFGDPFTHATMWSEDNGIGHLWKRFGSWMQKKYSYAGKCVEGKFGL